MSKYDKKIKKFMSNISLYNISPKIEKNQMLKNIYEIISSGKKCTSHHLIEELFIKRQHTKNEPPLIYQLYQNNIIIVSEITGNKIPKELIPFVDWFNNNIHNIDQYKISQKIKSQKSFPGSISEKIYDVIDQKLPPFSYLNDILYWNNFININIQQEIESSEILYSKFLINESDTLHVFSIINYQFSEIKRICEIFRIMKKFAKDVAGKELDIQMVIVLSKEKKKFPKIGETFCSVHINSGACLPGNYVHCWRIEELDKVIFHELMHYYEIDYFHGDISGKIKSCKFSGFDRVNESYAESLCILIKCLYKTYESKKTPLYNDDTWKTFIGYISNEINFNLFQLSKIIKISNGESVHDLIEKKIAINQETSVRSYYFIKTIFLLNPMFYSFIEKSIPLEGRKNQFIDLINQSFEVFAENNNAINNINIFITHINSSSVEKKSKWIYKTGKMSSQ
jgi:hypothetical protein